MGAEQIALMLSPYIIGGVASAIPAGEGAPEWWAGSTQYMDARRGRSQDYYNRLAGQQTDQYAGIQGLLDAIGSNVEGYTADTSRLQGRLSPYEDLMRNLGNRISTYADQFGNLQNQLATQGTTQLGIMRNMNDPNSYLRYMTNLGSQSNNLVDTALKNQLGDYEGRTADYAAQAANTARSAAASQMAQSGLLNTGAALEAIAGAGMDRQLEAAQNIAAARGQLMNQTYNNLMGAGSSAYQTQASNAVQGMNALSNLFGTRSDILNQAVGSLAQTGNQYGNAANVVNALINARNQQAATELGALGSQLSSRQNLWANLANLVSQDQQYESAAVRSGGLRDFLMGLAGGSGNLTGMIAGSGRAQQQTPTAQSSETGLSPTGIDFLARALGNGGGGGGSSLFADNANLYGLGAF